MQVASGFWDWKHGLGPAHVSPKMFKKNRLEYRTAANSRNEECISNNQIHVAVKLVKQACWSFLVLSHPSLCG